jgi:hypothetical protein
MKKAILRFARILGFGYPKRVIMLVDDQDKITLLEDFTINATRSRGSAAREAKEKQKEKIHGGEEGSNCNSNNEEGSESGSQNGIELSNKGKMSIVTDKRTGEVYGIQGDVEALFTPMRPSEIYREVGISAVLPGFIVYNLALFWLMEAIPPIDPYIMTVLGTGLILMSVFNARYAYTGVINSFMAMEKANIGGLRVFVPAKREYLALEPSDDRQLRDATMSAIIGKIRPLEATNEKLMQELHQVADKVDTAFKLGLRLRNTFMPSLEKLPAPALLIGLFLLGMILGWVLSGGVGMNMNAPVNGSVVP